MSILLILFILFSHVILEIFAGIIFYSEIIFIGFSWVTLLCWLQLPYRVVLCLPMLGVKGLQPASCLFYIKFLSGVSPPSRIMNSDFALMHGMGVGFRLLMSGSFSLIHLRGRSTSYDFLIPVTLCGSYFQHMCWNQNSIH